MRILLGVSGGIAAYKALELVRLATKAGHAVRVVQTPTSERFVGRASFAALTGAPVLADEFERDPARGAFPGDPAPTHDPLSHLELVANADVYVVAPASANTIAKLAGGHADIGADVGAARGLRLGDGPRPSQERGHRDDQTSQAPNGPSAAGGAGTSILGAPRRGGTGVGAVQGIGFPVKGRGV